MATKLDTDMSAWAPTTAHYELTDGTFVAVEADDGPTPAMEGAVTEVAGGALMTFTQRPTVIIACDRDGNATSLDRLFEFPAGTTHDEALTLAGLE